MSVRIRFARRLAATLVFGVAFGMSATAFGGALGGKSGSKTPPPPPEPAGKGTQTRVFTPQNTDPADVLRAINELLDGVAALEQTPDPAGPAGGPGLPPGPPPGGGGRPPGIGGPPGIGPMPGAPFGGFPPALGMLGGAGGPPIGHAARLALDKRTGSIIVRGPAKELQIAADLFKLLDTPRDQPLPESKSLLAFPLKHAGATELAALAAELEIGAAILALDEAKLLVVVGPADAVRELAELVNSLDAPTKKAPDPEKRKKLFPPETGA
jgi:type II secretory pathway component GspD/PulD (secretin)